MSQLCNGLAGMSLVRGNHNFQNMGYSNLNQKCVFNDINLTCIIYYYIHYSIWMSWESCSIFIYLAERLHDFVITVSNTSFPWTNFPLTEPEYVQCANHPGVAGAGNIKLDCQQQPIIGQYLSVHIQSTSPEILTICELQVFGLGKYLYWLCMIKMCLV